ncbi:MAG: type I-F CRISPR-associated endoribonuclease Cas6/Csy4 [Methyloprofundus sp.]|nr:type I-F CRISPR-associated endoribonuclease Cas6/Csy4 [Methyloprofundus sp.]
MKYYQEITLLPSPEVSINFLWQKLYQPLHLLMVETKSQSATEWLRVSFPQYTQSFLGEKLRVFAETEAVLQKMDFKKKFRNYDDYLHITEIRQTPESINGLIMFKRYQPKQNSQSHAARLAKRHGLKVDEAFKLLNAKPPLQLPFINLKSLSTKQDYRLRIQKQSIDSSQQQEITYNAYGLNNPIPDF